MNALALEQVVDRCADLGEVSIDPSMANPQARSLLIAINVGRNSSSLYTISVGTACRSEFWAGDATTYRRNHPHFLDSSCVMLTPSALDSLVCQRITDDKAFA